MKKLYIMGLIALAALCACHKPEPQAGTTQVTINFSPYTLEPIREVATLSDNVNHLDVWIAQGDDTLQFHQTSADTDFGTVSAMLDRTKTYTLHAVGHKVDGAATLAGGIIRFPGDAVKHPMYATATFTPATTTSLECTMQRICGMFKLIVQDAIPSTVDHFRFTISESGTRWNTATMEATNLIQREAVPSSMNPGSNGYVTFNIYVMADNLDDTKAVSITAAAEAQDNSVIKSRTFAAVPIKDGWVTTYQGEFFTDSWMIITFDCGGWESFDPVNINP